MSVICNICNKNFANERGIKVHFAIMHKGENYTQSNENSNEKSSRGRLFNFVLNYIKDRATQTVTVNEMALAAVNSKITTSKEVKNVASMIAETIRVNNARLKQIKRLSRGTYQFISPTEPKSSNSKNEVKKVPIDVEVKKINVPNVNLVSINELEVRVRMEEQIKYLTRKIQSQEEVIAVLSKLVPVLSSSE